MVSLGFHVSNDLRLCRICHSPETMQNLSFTWDYAESVMYLSICRICLSPETMQNLSFTWDYAESVFHIQTMVILSLRKVGEQDSIFSSDIFILNTTATGSVCRQYGTFDFTFLLNFQNKGSVLQYIPLSCTPVN